VFPSVNFVQPRPSESSSTSKNNLTLMKSIGAASGSRGARQAATHPACELDRQKKPVLRDVKEIILRLVASAVD
jgi:hypothetical protein